MASMVEIARKTLWTVDEKEFEGLLAPGLPFALKYFAAMFAVNAALQFATLLAATKDAVASLLFGAAIALAYAAGVGLVLPAVTHAALWIFRGQRPFGDTLQMYIYGATPGLLLSWVPCIGVFAPLVSLGNTFRGIRAINGIGFFEATLAVLVPMLGYWGMWMLLAAALVAGGR